MLPFCLSGILASVHFHYFGMDDDDGNDNVVDEKDQKM